MLHFKNLCQPHLAALLCMLYALSAQFGCLISVCHLPGVTNTLADVLSHGWLWWFFELCTNADWSPTLIIKCNLDFSDPETAGAHWLCEDVGTGLLAACDVGDIFMEWQPLPSEEIAAWLPSTAIFGPCGVLGRLGNSMP